MGESRLVCGGIESPDIRIGAQHAFVSAEALRPSELGAFDLGRDDRGVDCADDVLGYVVLQLEYLVEPAFISVRPDVAACPCADQLYRDANAIIRLSHGARQQIADPELAADLFGVDGPAS